ncbi:hypothetical protein Q1695_014309 [Nippostrongylus brasiliensis]|nr:hypothetical protein Q1695_014309 [Nippostrongylus brasiliensis]
MLSMVLWSSSQDRYAQTRVLPRKIDLPKYAFVNETVTAMVSVTSLNPMEETKYSVCLSELSRRVCADLGSYGQLGQPTYSRVVVSPSRPTDTKTFPVRFLSTGLSSVTFVLRQERSYPGKHHCDIGDIKDQVRLKVQIAQRDETDEIYKRIVLDMSKPSLSFLSNGMVYAPKAEHFYVEKKRSPRNTDVLIADVHTGIPDAGAVYSFSVDISKFLDDHASKSTDRARRDVDTEHVFLSDVIKSLSVELYQLKGIKKQPQHNDLETDSLQNRIGSLISDMLRFSDCKNESSCGYAEFGSPSKPKDRSIAFTAIATSLLCEAGSSRRLVCGGIDFLLQSIVENWVDDRVDLREIMDMVHPIDREWFLKSLLLQVSRDCAAYQCGKDDEVWYKLIASFYSLDEGRKWDLRSLAALAFMGTNATSEIMRIRLASMTNGNVLPFWNAGLWTLPQSSRSAGVGGASWYRKIKSGDILVNSLGILAHVSLGAEPRNINWDPLANWIYEQQLQDGTFENAIDTYFAARALYEYRLRRVPTRSNDDLKVTVRCPSCEPFTVNLTESATEIHLPTTARNVTLESEGHGKVNVGFRILTKKRLRSRRGLSQDDYYPVRIDVHQERVARGTMRQIVCLRVLSPAITTMEITHGLFTGYSATPENIGALPNSTQLSFVTPPTVSSFAVHALLEGFQHDKTLCYALGVTEPGHSHEPLHLAPVAITARHPTEGVVGLALISHPDQGRRSHRARRHSQSKPTSHLTCRYPFLKRIRRSLIDESIDTVCYQGGSCSCAESTCGVKCGVCAADVLSSLEDQVLKAKNFGALLRVLAVQRILVVNAFYTKISMDVREKRGGAATKISEKLEVWLRDCNPRCISSPPSVGDKFLMIGDAEALSVDSLGRRQYVLRNTDRFEKATSACGVLSNVIILG